MAALRPRSRLSKALPRTIVAILVGAVAVAAIAVISLGMTSSSNKAQASAKTPNQKRFKGTRPIVVDKQTGQQRLPNQEEVDEVVASLSVLASRPENLPQTPAAAGGISVDLEGGFGGVMLGRPNPDGTWETKCVFTFAEGAEFLGLVKDDSTE